MSKADLLKELEHLSQDDLHDIALRVTELLQVKHGLEMTVIEREVLERKIAEVQQSLGEGKDWSAVRARLIERLKW